MAKNEPKFDTAGRTKLRAWLDKEKANYSELARRLGTNPSTVSRWLSGDARPDPQYRPLLEHLAGIPDSDWLTKKEHKTVKSFLQKGSAA